MFRIYNARVSKKNKPFHLHADDYDAQTGGMLTQDEKVLAAYSTKLIEAQKKYPVREKESLSTD